MTKEDLSITYENNIFYCTKNNTKWISVDGEKWYGEEKRIAELEKENAELKKLKRECETSLCRAEYQYNYEQLIKAKEHIRTLISCLINWVQEGDKDYCYIAEAEQFLSCKEILNN